MRRSTHHPVADAERIEDIEAQQSDMRGLQDIAAGVEDDVGNLLLAARRRLLAQALEDRIGQLQPR
jgi:hypothetical protein